MNPELKARREEYHKISSALGKMEKEASMPQQKQVDQQQAARKDISFD